MEWFQKLETPRVCCFWELLGKVDAREAPKSHPAFFCNGDNWDLCWIYKIIGKDKYSEIQNLLYSRALLRILLTF